MFKRIGLITNIDPEANEKEKSYVTIMITFWFEHGGYYGAYAQLVDDNYGGFVWIGDGLVSRLANDLAKSLNLNGTSIFDR